jgi:NAD-dependent dihydropyrimidine dehydrogenase PreA subunit
MITMVCPCCEAILLNSNIKIQDATSVTFQCKCEAVYRVSVTMLHEGKSQPCQHLHQNVYVDDSRKCIDCGAVVRHTPTKEITT